MPSVEIVVFIALIQLKVMFLQYEGIFTTLQILFLELKMWCFHHRMAAPDSPWISRGWRPALNQKYQDLWAQGQNHPGIRSTSKYFLFLPSVQILHLGIDTQSNCMNQSEKNVEQINSLTANFVPDIFV